MARDFVYIGPSPAEEDCAQVGSDNYHELARKECSALIAQLRRQFGQEPDGAELRVKRESHDFGSYLEVVCYYDERSQAAIEYAYKCEGNLPATWDEEARRELGI